MRKMNISVPMMYKDKHGADKTKWINIGNIVITDDGKVFGDINATPVGDWDGSFSCFDREEKQNNNQNQNQNQTHPQGYNQNQSYQAPQQEYKNAQGQVTDANGNVLPQQ